MGDAQAVMKAYQNHLKNNIKSKASMSFDKGGAKVKKLSGLYIIGDPAGKTECFIGAHGGQFATDYVLDNKSFSVPSGCTIDFYAPHGYAFGMWSRNLRNQRPVANDGQNDTHYTAGEEVPNYMLSKFAGSHSGAANPAADDEDYSGWQKIAADADILIVTIRNRWYRSGVTLKTVMSDIRSEMRNIKTFNCMFCRVDENWAAGGGWTWNAGGGTWYQ